MDRNRQDDIETLEAVHAAAVGGDLDRGATLARRALADGLEHPLLYNVAAIELEQRDGPRAAVAYLRDAVVRFATDVGLRNALGLVLLRLDDPGAALTEFDALLAIDDALPHAYASRGMALLWLGRLAAADASFRRALDLDPVQAVALSGLADVAARRGQWADASGHATRALALLPNYTPAVLSLAAAELGLGQLPAAAARLEALIGVPAVEAREHATAHGLLGDVRDAQGRISEAFSEYTACNGILRDAYAPRFAGRESAGEYAQRLFARFQRFQAAEWPNDDLSAQQLPAARHAFVVGFPRCGTTLLEVALDGQSGAVSPGEHEFLIDAVNEYLSNPDDLDRLVLASRAELDHFRATYWQRVAETGVSISGRCFIDKHPLNTLKLPLIARLFPTARIVMMHRDPRDVVLSCFRHRFQMSSPIFELLTLDGASRFYDVMQRLALRFEEALPLPIRHVRYERLVNDFEAEMRGICAFIGVDWTPAMRDFGERTRHRATATPSTAQLARGLHPGGIGTWRRYRDALEPVLPRLETWRKHFGYEPF